MNQLSRNQVRHIATLSRLEFSDEEADLFARQLTQILEYVDKLGELQVDGVEPTAHSIPMDNVLRPDRTRPSLPPERALANAPEVEQGCFKVPPIIQEI